MAYRDRIELYRRIEQIRKRPLLAYVTSSRPNASGAIASDAVPYFARQIRAIPPEERNVDVLIVSNGGDPTVSWRLVCMLRERFGEVGVLLPYAAYSAATLVALGADEIVMHQFSNLGPVDPQMRHVRRVPGSPPGQEETETIMFGAEDLRYFLDFVRKDVGVSDQEQMERAFELICKDVGAIPIGAAKRSSYLALSMGEKLLSLHMEDQNKAKAIAEALNTSFYHHGYPVGRSEAKEIGLPIRDAEGELEECMWQVWEDVEAEMECNHPFSPVEVLLADRSAAELLSPVYQVQIPANLPPEIRQHAIQAVLQQIQVVQVPPVDYTLLLATLESSRQAWHFRVGGKISGVRLPDMNIALNILQTSQGWQNATADSAA